MDEASTTGPAAGRRNEDIALDLMKFIAMTTGYGRTTSSGVGFQAPALPPSPKTTPTTCSSCTASVWVQSLRRSSTTFQKAGQCESTLRLVC